MNFVIYNASVLSGNNFLPNHSVLCRDGKIIDILPNEQLSLIEAERYDASGGFLVPGFIDMHFHGARMLLAENSSESLISICDMLPEFGVTGFLPAVTPLSTPGADIERLSVLSKVKSPMILGFFLEGHYLSLTGALKKSSTDMSLAYLNALIEAAASYKTVFAVSPELEGIETLLPVMTRNGCPAFITHTRADSRRTELAISLGARHATHFYDVFPYPGDKEPGVRGCGVLEAIMAHPEVSVDFILDGEHVDPIAVKMALACKGADGVCLITDANICAGMPPGRFAGGLSGYDISTAYSGAPGRLCDDSGHPGELAGSGLTMDKAVRNAVELLGLPLATAVGMASANPAKVLGLAQKGKISPGFDADLTLLNENLTVSACWVAGEIKKINNKAR